VNVIIFIKEFVYAVERTVASGSSTCKNKAVNEAGIALL